MLTSRDLTRRRTEDLRKLCIQMEKRIKALEKEVKSLRRWKGYRTVGRC